MMISIRMVHCLSSFVCKISNNCSIEVKRFHKYIFKELISPYNTIYQNIKNSIENLPSGSDEVDWGQIKESVCLQEMHSFAL